MGFKIIKDRVITPLMVASERIVEYIMPFSNMDSSMSDEIFKDDPLHTP
jgi:hypothetical protein